jgi:hypothetical protein
MSVVELEVFAGRPNPRFTLAPAGSRHLLELLGRLSEPATPFRPRLGYQGLAVYARGADGRWRPWLHVGGGRVTVRYGPRAGVYRDTIDLEGWLLDEADRAGLGPVLDQVLPGRRRQAR